MRISMLTRIQFVSRTAPFPAAAGRSGMAASQSHPHPVKAAIAAS